MAKHSVIYFGTADFAVPSLQRLSDLSDMFEILAVVTQPDRQANRGMRPQFSPVKKLAVQLGLNVLQPEKARCPEFLEQVKELSPDVGVVAAYGQILKSALLEIPRFGMVNIHGSVLPKYRGAAPIQWALWNGETETGVTLIRMDVGLDTGDMFAKALIPIEPTITAGALHDKLADLGADLVASDLPAYVQGMAKFEKQNNELSTYARKISKADGVLDWSKPARQLDLQIRALTPWPGAETWISSGSINGGTQTLKRVKILQAREVVGGPLTLSFSQSGLPVAEQLACVEIIIGCGDGTFLEIQRLQLEGKKPMDAQAFLSGYTVNSQEPLGSSVTGNGD